MNDSISWIIRMRGGHGTKAQTPDSYREMWAALPQNACWGPQGISSRWTFNCYSAAELVFSVDWFHQQNSQLLGCEYAQGYLHGLCFFYLLSFFNSHFLGLKLTPQMKIPSHVLDRSRSWSLVGFSYLLWWMDKIKKHSRNVRLALRVSASSGQSG